MVGIRGADVDAEEEAGGQVRIEGLGFVVWGADADLKYHLGTRRGASVGLVVRFLAVALFLHPLSNLRLRSLRIPQFLSV